MGCIIGGRRGGALKVTMCYGGVEKRVHKITVTCFIDGPLDIPKNKGTKENWSCDRFVILLRETLFPSSSQYHFDFLGELQIFLNIDIIWLLYYSLYDAPPLNRSFIMLNDRENLE